MNRIARQFLLLLGLAMISLNSHAANPKVEVVTNQGSFTIELYPDKAPVTVKNFLDYVDAGQYDGTIFHRVISNFMIQGGGYTPDYQKKATNAAILNEADNGLPNRTGSVAMARTGAPHSATAQFFVNVKDNSFLNHRSKSPRGWGYTVFGQVIDGMTTVNTIRAVDTGAGGPFSKDAPKSQVVITSIKRLK